VLTVRCASAGLENATAIKAIRTFRMLLICAPKRGLGT
jgi:hypothetical protein